MKNKFVAGFTTLTFITIFLMIVVIGLVYYFASTRQSSNDENKKSKKSENEIVVPTENGKYSGAVLAGESSPLLDFTKSDYEAFLKTDKLIVLYFYANWCPICRAEFPLMQEAFNELLTDNVIGFRVNYNDDQTDSDEKNLAREFGVAYQHTKVFVNNGLRILKSLESWGKDRYLSEISKVQEAKQP